MQQLHRLPSSSAVSLRHLKAVDLAARSSQPSSSSLRAEEVEARHLRWRVVEAEGHPEAEGELTHLEEGVELQGLAEEGEVMTSVQIGSSQPDFLRSLCCHS